MKVLWPEGNLKLKRFKITMFGEDRDAIFDGENIYVFTRFDLKGFYYTVEKNFISFQSYKTDTNFELENFYSFDNSEFMEMAVYLFLKDRKRYIINTTDGITSFRMFFNFKNIEEFKEFLK